MDYVKHRMKTCLSLKSLFLALSSLLLSTAWAGVRINEIHYKDPSATYEFIELYNDGPAITVGNWSLEGVTYTFTAGTVIPANGYVLLTSNPGAFVAAHPGVTVDGLFSGTLDNGGGSLRLLNNAGVEQDVVQYDDRWPWPPEADGAGASLQRIDANFSGLRPGNWTANLGVGSTPRAANSYTTTLPPFIDAWINEVSPQQSWLEIVTEPYNEIVQIWLTDDPNNLTKWGLLPFYIDPFVAVAGLDLIDPDDGTIALVIENGTGTFILDSFKYNLVGDTHSYGLLPDGEPLTRSLFHIPTPGSANNATSLPTPVRFNEWMAKNNGIVLDPADNQPDDWFELHNNSPLPADLSLYTVTDNPANPSKNVLPFGTVIPAYGHLVLWADEQPAQGVDHMNFKLSANGEQLQLYAPDGTLATQVSFGAQIANRSQGTWKDGEPAPYYSLAVPTPGGANLYSAINQAPSIISAPNLNVSHGTLLSSYITAYNPESPPQTMVFSLSGAPVGMSINPASGLITWTPGAGFAGTTHNLTTTVSDDGVPPKQVSANFVVSVNAVNQAPIIQLVPPQTIPENEQFSLFLSATDPDLPGQSLSWSLGAGAPLGVTLSAAGLLQWTPSESQGPGLHGVSITVTDNGVPQLSDTTFINFTVTEENSTPSTVAITDQTITEGNLLNFQVIASDPDPGQMLTFSLPVAPAGASIDPVTGWFNWTPSEAQGPATYPVTIHISDNGTPPESTNLQFNIVVEEFNDAPSIIAPGSQTFDELAPFSLQLLATDTDIPVQSLTWSLMSTPPSGLNLDTATGLLTWTPSEAQGPSSYLVEVRVTDNGSPVRFNTITVTLNVNEVNQAPENGTIPDQSVTEGTLMVIGLQGIDNDLPAQNLTYSLVTGPTGAEIDPSTGILAWVPAENQAPASHNVVLRVTDDGSPSLFRDYAFVIHTIETNTKPSLFNPGNRTIEENVTWNLPLSASDVDIPVQSLTYSLEAGAPSGLTINPVSGMINWTPDDSQGGGDYLVAVRVTDNGTPSTMFDREDFVVTVNPHNDAPVITPIANQSVTEGNLLSLAVNASDPDPGQTLNYSLIGGPVGATINMTSGVFSWTPNESQGGASFVATVLVTDDGNPTRSAVASFNITAIEANQAPVATQPASFTINEQAAFTTTLSATDNDLPAQPLTWAIIGSAPSGLSLTPGSGVLSWTPSETQGPATYSVDVEVTDNGAPPKSDTMTLNIQVNEVNRAPSVTSSPNQTIDPAQLFTRNMSATDPDIPTQSLNWSLDAGAPTGMSIHPTSGLISWTPTIAQANTAYPVTARATDDGSPTRSATTTFTITVDASNLSPVASQPGLLTLNEQVAFSTTLTATDNDLPAQTLTWAILGSAPNGLSLNPGSGLLTWTPSEAQGPASYSIEVEVTDNGTPAKSDTMTVSFQVNEVNRTPSVASSPNQTIDPAQLFTRSISATDPDLPAQSLSWSLEAGAPTGMSIHPTSGLISWTPTIAQANTAYPVTARATDNGSPAQSATTTFTITVDESNLSPVANQPAPFTVNEHVAFTTTLTATDNDLPAQTLTWSIVGSAPSGLSLNPTSGLLAWTPSEAQGPASYSIDVQVTDNGTPVKSDTITLSIQVNEVNRTPTVASTPDETIAPDVLFTRNMSATDPDLPAQALTWSLDAGMPTGMTIHPTTGLVSWTPTSAQGPATYLISVRASDSGSPVLVDQQDFLLSVTGSASNEAPTINGPFSFNLSEQTTFTHTLSASDTDTPVQTITWSIDGAIPTGLYLNPSTGAIVWTPNESHGGTTQTVTFRATDNGLPAASATQAYTFTVSEVNTPPTATLVAPQTIPAETLFNMTISANDTDTPAQTLLYSVLSAPSGFSVHPFTGVVTWTPSPAQAPGTYSITVRVTDNGSPRRYDDLTFSIDVIPANHAPSLVRPGSRTIEEGVTWTLGLSASDSDVPAQTLTFSLGAGSPDGLTVNPTTGLLSWTPSPNQGGTTYPIIIRVTDNGIPALTTEKTFNLTVSDGLEMPSVKLTATTLEVKTSPGQTYTIEECTDLTAGIWTTHTTFVSTESLTVIPLPNHPNCYIRVGWVTP